MRQGSVENMTIRLLDFWSKCSSVKRNVLTMSFAPRDSHEAQVHFSLERGVLVEIGVMGTQQLPYPSHSRDRNVEICEIIRRSSFLFTILHCINDYFHKYQLLVSCNSNNYVVCRLISIINLFEYHHCQAITTS